MATFLSCAGSSERNPCEHRYGVVFSYFIYDSDRPHLVSPRHAAGSSPGNPLILVRDEVLDENPDHICSSVVDAA